jgi:hypothetical protein
MINLGVIDILFLLILIGAFVLASRRRNIAAFFVVLVLILLIELERLAPGMLATIGNTIHGIDAFNQQMPHVQISPVITIK